MLSRIRRRLQRNYRFVMYTVLLAVLHLAIEPDFAYAQVYEQAKDRREREEEIAKNLGLDPEYVKDPQAYEARKAKEAEKAMAAAAAAAADAAEKAKPKTWDELPDHVKQKMAVKDKYRTYLLASADREMREMVRGRAGGGDLRDATRRLRAERQMADSVIQAYDVALAGIDEKAQRFTELGQEERGKRFAARARSVRDQYGPVMDGLRRVRAAAPADAMPMMDELRPGLERHVADVEKKHARKFREAPSTLSPPQVLEPLEVAEESGDGWTIRTFQQDGQVDEKRVRAADLPSPRTIGFGWGFGLTKSLEIAASSILPATLTAAVLPDKPGTSTPEGTVDGVAELAAQLDHDPLKIYNHLRTQFAYEPYWGQMKGARGALAEKAGNDMDLSQLLVALLRECGVPAEYVWGTVVLTPEQIQNLTGIDDTSKAGSFLNTAGLKPKQLLVGGQLLTKVQHVWVVAGLDYEHARASRGEDAGAKDTWIPMDVSFKQMEWQDGMPELLTEDFDGPQVLEDMDSAQPKSPLDHFREQMWQRIKDDDITCTTLEQVTRNGRIAQHEFPYVPSSLEHERLPPGTMWGPWPVADERRWNGTSSPIPNGLVHDLMIDFYEIGLRGTAHMADLYGKRITVEFDPLQGELLNNPAVGPLSTDPQSFHLRPVVRAHDGVTVVELAVGSDDIADMEWYEPGTEALFQLRYIVPGDVDDVLTHSMTAGACGVVSLDYGRGPESAVDSALAEYKAALEANPAGDHEDTIMKGLHAVGKRYYRDLVEDFDWSFALNHVRTVRRCYGAFIQRRVDGEVWQATNENIDLRRLVVGPFGADGDQSRNKEAVTLAGYSSSYREHDCWRTTLMEDGISAVRALALAHDTPGNSIAYITSSGQLSSLGIPDEDKAIIGPAVDGGRVAWVTHELVTLGGWTGAGYILQRPDSGDASYMIGATKGGDTVESALGSLSELGDLGFEEWLNGAMSLYQMVASMASFISSSGLSVPGADSDGCYGVICADPVNLTSGNHIEKATDATVARMPLPVIFQRTYNSKDPEEGVLGRGWTHSYELTLRDATGAAPDWGDDPIRYDDEDGTRHLFSWMGSGYESPAGKHMQLTELPANEWKLRNKNGSYVVFDPAGELVRQGSDVYPGVEMQFVRSGGRLDEIRDPHGNVVLDLDYIGSRLHQITDPTGRYWTFDYDGQQRLSGIVDPAGREAAPSSPLAWHYDYDSAGLMSRRVDPLGNEESYFYDEQGRFYAHRDATGATEYFMYDQGGNRALLTSGTVSERVVEYDETRRATGFIDPLGNRSSQEWSDDNMLESRETAQGQSMTWAHDPNGNQVQHQVDGVTQWTRTFEPTYSRVQTESVPGVLERTVTWTDSPTEHRVDVLADPVVGAPYFESTQIADGEGKLFRTEGAEGQGPRAVTVATFESDGRLDGFTDPLGVVVDLTQDASGRHQAMNVADGQSGAFTYDGMGRMEGVNMEGAWPVVVDFDTSGRMVGMSNAYRDETREVDGVGRPTSIDVNGATTRMEYDADGRTTAIVDPRGSRTRYRYDELGRLVESVLADGSIWTYRHCAADGCAACRATRPCEVVAPDGTVVLHVDYDEHGRVRRTENGLGQWREFVYDTSGRLVLERWPRTVGSTSSVLEKTRTYDHAGRLASVTEPGATSPVQYQWDNLGRRTGVIDANGGVWTFGHDARGRVIWRQTPSGDRTQYAHDGRDRRKVVLHEDGTGLKYVYDLPSGLPGEPGDDNPLTLDVVRSFSGIPDGTDGHPDMALALAAPGDDPPVRSFRYDTRGHMVEASNIDSRRTFARDEHGRLDGVTDVTLGETLEYTFDGNGNRTTMTGSAGTTYYHYDAMDRLVRLVDPLTGSFEYTYDARGAKASLRRPNGVTTWWERDAAGRVSSILSKDSTGDVLQALAYLRDEEGNVVRSTDALSGDVTSFAYDAQERLTSADYPGPQRDDFSSYDEAGNRLTWSDETKTVTGTPNLDHQIVSESWDTAGPLLEDAIRTYTFDDRGRLLQKRHDDLNLSTSDTVDYIWDRFQLREVHDSTLGNFRMTYDALGSRVSRGEWTGTEWADTAFLLDGDTVVAEFVGSPAVMTKWITLGAEVDEMLAIWSSSGVVYPLVDDLGTIVAVTDGAGVLGATQSIRAFGGLRTAPIDGVRPSFTGRDRDPSTLSYFRARYLDHESGRFTSMDPEEDTPGESRSLHRYAYAWNEPTNLRDPSGRSPTIPSGVWLVAPYIEIGAFAVCSGVVFSGTYYNATNNRGRHVAMSAASVTAMFGVGGLEIGVSVGGGVLLNGFETSAIDGISNGIDVGVLCWEMAVMVNADLVPGPNGPATSVELTTGLGASVVDVNPIGLLLLSWHICYAFEVVYYMGELTI